MTKLLAPLALVVAAAALGACATGRPTGQVAIGDTPEKVLSVYGKPDRVYRRQTVDGELAFWGYMPFWPGFGVTPEPRQEKPQVSREIPLESIRDDEDVRVFFKAGKVAAVEYRNNK